MKLAFLAGVAFGSFVTVVWWLTRLTDREPEPLTEDQAIREDWLDGTQRVIAAIDDESWRW